MSGTLDTLSKISGFRTLSRDADKKSRRGRATAKSMLETCSIATQTISVAVTKSASCQTDFKSHGERLFDNHFFLLLVVCLLGDFTQSS